MAYACDAPKANERASKKARVLAELIKRDCSLLMMLHPFASRRPQSVVRYFPADARSEMMVLKVAFRPDPRALTTPRIATEIPAAIRPYSIAVAPDSSRRNSATFVMVSCSKTHCGVVRPIPLLAMKSKKSLDRFRKFFQFPARFREQRPVQRKAGPPPGAAVAPSPSQSLHAPVMIRG